MTTTASPNSSELFIWASPAWHCCATKLNVIILKCMKAQQRHEQIKSEQSCKLKSITSSNSQRHPQSSVTPITPSGWVCGDKRLDAPGKGCCSSVGATPVPVARPSSAPIRPVPSQTSLLCLGKTSQNRVYGHALCTDPPLVYIMIKSRHPS